MADHATILRPVQFLAIIGIALYLVPTGAHVAELASKMALAPADYMTAQVWTTTFPVNAATQSWTVMPEAFEAARRQWEYSHAVSAALTFLALVTIVWSALVSNPQSYEIAPIRTE